MKIVVIGATGTIGKAVSSALQEHEVIKVGLNNGDYQMNLESPESIRDLFASIGKVDAVVAIHPYEERPPLSTGMMDELGHARDYLKKRYMIFPPKNLSPFTTDSYIEKGHIYSGADGFFDDLESEGYEPYDYPKAVRDVEWESAIKLV